MVNVPEYRLRLVEDGERGASRAALIVGKENSPTPIFSEDMKYLVINPSWTLPPSILKKEFLPALAADPDYAARRGLPQSSETATASPCSNLRENGMRSV